MNNTRTIYQASLGCEGAEMEPREPKMAPKAETQDDDVSTMLTINLYRPLSVESREIRVLCLLPGFWGDLIRCELRTRSLSDAHGQYEALSYAWDAEPGFETITVDEQSISIKRNLFLALRRLRKGTEPRVMWVDALCIDQHSNEEKSHQVALMRDIYRACVRVYLWLGDCSNEEADTRTVDDGNREAPEDQGQQDHMFQAFTLIRELSTNAHLHELSCYNEARKRPFHTGTFDALAELVSSSWWERLWVVQEKILSPQAILVHGSLTAPWDVISKAMDNVIRHAKECCQKSWARLRTKQNSAMLKCMRTVREFGQLNDRTNSWMVFYHFILHHRNRKASDARDVVYGLSALAPNIPHELMADYTLSKEEVYKRLVLLLIREHETLHALRGQRTLNKDFKSWIYDWSSDVDDRLWYLENMRLEVKLYAASKNKKPIVSTNTQGQLLVDGVYFDRVVQKGRICENSPASRLGVIRDWYKMCQDSCTQLPPSMWREDFLRTVTGDVDYVLDRQGILKIGVRAPVNFKDVLDDWMVSRSGGGSDKLAINKFDDLVKTMTTGLAFFLTEKGYMGLGKAETGDEIWVLFGGERPFLLRHDTSSANHWLIGDCFVHGIMDGEALECWRKDTKTVQLQ